MFLYGKMIANAIAVMSYLAMNPDRCIGSSEIAAARNLSQPLTAKILTQLATAGLVTGRRGPGGGYWLGKPAEEISLFQIACLFEQQTKPDLCPFGPGWCGSGPPCPLHDQLAELMNDQRKFLENHRLSVFVTHPEECWPENVHEVQRSLSF